MRYGKHVFKGLGLCLIALGAMMTSAIGAQAAEWKESGTTISTTKNIAGVTDKDVNGNDIDWTLDSSVAGAPIKILCTQLAVNEGKLFGTSSGTPGQALAKLDFTSCKTFLSGSESMPCLPKEPISATVIIKQFLHGGEDYLLFSPDDGTLVFTTIELTKEGPGCSVGEKFNIKGHAVVEDCAHEPRVSKTEHLIQQSASTTLFTGANLNELKFGANSAQLLGSEKIKLASGNPWNANAL